MPFDLRWFNIFFTTFGTAFVGIIFGSLAGLQEECDEDTMPGRDESCPK